MNPYQIMIWILIGLCIALIHFTTQYWSVRIINPDKYRFSQWLIIGGAVIRWALIGLIFGFALSNSFSAMLIVFSSFLIGRLILVNTFSTMWQNASGSRQ